MTIDSECRLQVIKHTALSCSTRSIQVYDTQIYLDVFEDKRATIANVLNTNLHYIYII